MFAALPSGFGKLEALVRSKNAEPLVPSRSAELLAPQLRAVYDEASADNYRSLRISHWRKLPYAYWLAGEPPLPQAHPKLVRRYWSQVLPEAIAARPHTAKRWLAPLLDTYCEHFIPRDSLFLDYAQSISDQLKGGARHASNDSYMGCLQALQQEVGFFNPRIVATQLAMELIVESESVEQAMASRRFWPGFVDTRLGAAVLAAALGWSADRLRKPKLAAHLLDWGQQISGTVAATEYGVLFADALLSPWLKHHPPEELRRRLVDFFVASYGDPRHAGRRGYSWAGVSADALRVMMKLLAGGNLRSFVQVLHATADEQWEYRGKFWMAYYAAGAIDEAWLVLGRDATALAKTLGLGFSGYDFGRLEGGSDPKQSALLMKIEDLIFVEFSHNGSLRAYRENDQQAPLLYQRTYDVAEIRATVSMDFHEGANQKPELDHRYPELGTWQKKAQKFIRRHTKASIHLTDNEILL